MSGLTLFNRWHLLLLISLTVLSVVLLDHSQLDLWISQLFYNNGSWIIDKSQQPYRFIFYRLPKILMQLLALYLLAVIIFRYRQQAADSALSKPRSNLPNLHFNKQLYPLTEAELFYLLFTLSLIALVLSNLKDMTHVGCPNHLIPFGGELPYLSVWDNIRAKTPSKCFPAAHAGLIFSLYAFAYIPRLYHNRIKIIVWVTVLGWVMGGYKMLIGDHFFSHTVFSMLLAWSLAYGMGMLFFSKTKEVFYF